jgi:hypothetical protein
MPDGSNCLWSTLSMQRWLSVALTVWITGSSAKLGQHLKVRRTGPTRGLSKQYERNCQGLDSDDQGGAVTHSGSLRVR